MEISFKDIEECLKKNVEIKYMSKDCYFYLFFDSFKTKKFLQENYERILGENNENEELIENILNELKKSEADLLDILPIEKEAVDDDDTIFIKQDPNFELVGGYDDLFYVF